MMRSKIHAGEKSMTVRVAVLYGGRSTEHEVSCRSASTVIRNLQPRFADLLIIGIDRDGRWFFQDQSRCEAQAQKGEPLTISCEFALTSADLSAKQKQFVNQVFFFEKPNASEPELVVFPMLHGSNGEDGTIQGLLELAGVAFVGCDLAGSAIGMDKGLSKRLAREAGVKVAPFIELESDEWSSIRSQSHGLVEETMQYPVFVKPARLGSSVGIVKCKSREELIVACESAFQFDDKLVIEQGLDVREIECAVLGGVDAQTSIVGEVIPQVEFYTYEAKYLDDAGAAIKVPADLTEEQQGFAQEMSRKIYRALGLYGLARIDLFLEKSSGTFYFNEVNTLPGFTSISQYPMLWRASGIETPELVERLIHFALARHQRRSRLQRNR
jgi:D-alanine-D-alanine ligase